MRPPDEHSVGDEIDEWDEISQLDADAYTKDEPKWDCFEQCQIKALLNDAQTRHCDFLLIVKKKQRICINLQSAYLVDGDDASDDIQLIDTWQQ